MSPRFGAGSLLTLMVRGFLVHSRAHLGDHGGGMVRLDDVIGSVDRITWPPGRAGGPEVAYVLEYVPATNGAERHQ